MKLVCESIQELNDNKFFNIYAWLYFLTYVYADGMVEKSWKNDKRMGELTFIECAEILKNKDLIFNHDGVWNCKDQNRCKEILLNIFGKYDNEEDAIEAGKKFKQYDTKDYSISRMPLDMFQKEDRETMENTNLTQKEYLTLQVWLKKYQREAQGWWNRLNPYCGLEGDLIRKNFNYTLYRGIFLDDERFKDLKVGDAVFNKRLSWTLSKGMAERFAFGNKHWMDRKENIPEGKIGIILKHKFEPKDILVDMNYASEKHPAFKNMIDWPDEKEVIVKPKSDKYEIIEIFRHER